MELLREQGSVVERRARSGSPAASLGEDKDNVLIRSDGAPDLLRLGHRLPLRQVRPPRLRPGDRHLGRRPPGPRLAHEGGRRRRSASTRSGWRSSSTSSSACKRGGETVRFSKRAGEIITPARGRRRGRRRRLPLLLPAALGRRADGVRPRPGEAAEQREPGLLRAVRPRPHRRHPRAGRRARPRLRGRRRRAAAPPGGAGAGPQDAAAAGAGRVDRREPTSRTTCRTTRWSWRRPSTTSTRSAASSTTRTRRFRARACGSSRRRSRLSRAPCR